MAGDVVVPNANSVHCQLNLGIGSSDIRLSPNKHPRHDHDQDAIARREREACDINLPLLLT